MNYLLRKKITVFKYVHKKKPEQIAQASYF